MKFAFAKVEASFPVATALWRTSLVNEGLCEITCNASNNWESLSNRSNEVFVSSAYSIRIFLHLFLFISIYIC